MNQVDFADVLSGCIESAIKEEHGQGCELVAFDLGERGDPVLKAVIMKRNVERIVCIPIGAIDRAFNTSPKHKKKMKAKLSVLEQKIA